MGSYQGGRSLVQPPVQGRGAVGPEQADQGFIQLDLLHFLGLKLHSLSGQLAPLRVCPYDDKVFPYIQSESLLF